VIVESFGGIWGSTIALGLYSTQKHQNEHNWQSFYTRVFWKSFLSFLCVCVIVCFLTHAHTGITGLIVGGIGLLNVINLLSKSFQRSSKWIKLTHLTKKSKSFYDLQFDL
jgi:hypothetical protein